MPCLATAPHLFELIVDDGDFLNQLSDISCLPADNDGERQAKREQEKDGEEKHHI